MKLVWSTVFHKIYATKKKLHIDKLFLDGLLDEEKKRNMLKDLDVLIRVGSHSNVVKLVGICENPETLFIVVELHPATLKDVLLESRCLEHSSSTQQLICSLSETSMLEIAIGVARGMEHLTHKKVKY